MMVSSALALGAFITPGQKVPSTKYSFWSIWNHMVLQLSIQNLMVGDVKGTSTFGLTLSSLIYYYW
jgi:hypothetical protein